MSGNAAFQRAKLMKKKNKGKRKKRSLSQAAGDDAGVIRRRAEEESVFTPAAASLVAEAAMRASNLTSVAGPPPSQQLTAIQMMAQQRGPDTVPVAELERLRSLPSVANASTSDDDHSGSERAASGEPPEPAALRAELSGLKPRALQKRAEALGVDVDALDAADDAAAFIELIMARADELAAEEAAARPVDSAAAEAAAAGGPEGGEARAAARVAKRKKKGQKQLDNGDAKAALATIEAALALAPGDAELLSLKTTAAGKLGKPKKERSEEKKKLRREQKAAKRAKLQAHLTEKGGRAAVVTPSMASEHPFAVSDEKDHAETPFDAYRDIEPFLFQLGMRRKRSKAKVKIYDPYFCEGSVVHHLKRLGFESVYNKNEDFYAAIDQKTTPDHEILMTNPPYSDDHWEKLLDFGCYGPEAKDANRPLLALMPDFIARRSGFKKRAAESGRRWVYLGPKDKGYTFAAPTTAADGQSALLSTKKDGSAFVPSQNEFQLFTCNSFQCVWYMQLGTDAETESLVAWWKKKYSKSATCAVADSVDELPQLTDVENERRERKYLKKKARLQAEDAAKAGGGGSGADGASGGGGGGGSDASGGGASA